MNKKLRLFSEIKAAGLFVPFLFAFLSCDNFLTGNQIKDEIKSSIEYNNSSPFTIRVEAVKGSGVIKTPAAGEVSRKVSDTFTVKFEPESSHRFMKWEAVVTGMAQGETAEDYIEFESPLSYETKVTVKKAGPAILIRPVCPEYLILTDFNMDDSDMEYPKDSTVLLTFNKSIEEECFEKIQVNIPNLDEGKTSADYYKPPRFCNETRTQVAISADYEKDGQYNYIPVAKNKKKTVYITLDANDFYYINNDYSEPVKMYLEQDLKKSYTINSETSSQTLIRFYVEDEDAGIFKIDGTRVDGRTQYYSIGKSIELNYKVASGYKFYGWNLYRMVQNDSGEDEMQAVGDEDLEGFLSFSYEEYEDSLGYDSASNTVAAVLNINNSFEDTLYIMPLVSRIPVVTVRLETESGTGSTSPVTGTYSILEGSANSIEFFPNGDYEFIRWNFTDALTGTELNDKQVFIENPEERKTSYTIMDSSGTSGLESIVLKPVVAIRPKTISHTPIFEENGSRMDATIQVMFDQEMDPGSIYYSEEELGLIDYDSLLKDKSDPDKIYGYTKNGLNYFKNISIVNNYDGSNLLEYFDAPVFENAKTLSVPVKTSNPVPSYTQVLVTLEKDFFYRHDKARVPMYSSEKWLYQVNEEKDDSAPVPKSEDFKVRLEKEGKEVTDVPSVTDLSTLNYLIDNKLYMDFSVNDLGGTSSAFSIVCTKKIDGNYSPVTGTVTREIPCSYTGSISSKSVFKGTADLSSLEDGVYSVKFKFTDRANNTTYYPEKDTYYIAVDNTAPAMTAPVITDEEGGDGKIRLEWNYSDYKDFKETRIEYRVTGSDNEFSSPLTVGRGSSCKELNLSGGTSYDFKVTYVDLNGNKKERESRFITRPNTPKALTVNASNNKGNTLLTYGDTSVDLKVTRPDSGNFDGIKIRKRIKDSESWSGFETIDVSYENQEEFQQSFANLEKGRVYEFEVCSYDEQTGKCSLPYKVSSRYPSFTTLPAPADINSLAMNSYTNSTYVYYKTPSSNFDGIKVIYSKNSDFSSPKPVPISNSYSGNFGLSSSKNHYVSGLEAGTYYYVKVRSWFGNEENYVDSSILSSYTKPLPVGSFIASSKTNDSITLDWTKPSSGRITGFRIYGKESTDSSWPAHPLEINNTGITSFTFDQLKGGTKYDFKINTFSYNAGDDVLLASSVETYPNEVTNLSAQKGSSTDSINVTWTKPAGLYSKLLLYMADSESGLKSASPVNVTSETSKPYTSLTTGSTYYFKMVSESSTGLRTESNVISCSTAINPVTGLSATVTSHTGVNLSWTNPAEYDGLRIYRGTSYSSINTLCDNITRKSVKSYTVSNLTPNTVYYFKIVAYKQVDGREVTATATLSSSYRTKGSPVTNLKAESKTNSTVKLTWTNPSSTAYWQNIYIYNGSTLVQTITDKTTTSYTVTGLSGGTAYTFNVKTSNGGGAINSTNYASVSETTSVSPVTGLKVISSGQTSAAIQWTKTEGNFTGTRVYYRKYDSKNDVDTYRLYTTNTNKDTVSCTITGLTAGLTYKFKVVSYRTIDSSSSDESTDSECTAYMAPYSVSGLSVSSRTTSSITYSWSNPSNYTGMYFFYKPSSSSYYNSLALSKGSTSYTLKNLTGGTKYDVYIMTYNYSTSYSTTSTVITRATTPNAVSGVSARVYEGDVVLSWSNPGGNRDYYEVCYRKRGNSSWTTENSSISSGTLTLTIPNSTFTPNTQYDFRVRAKVSDASTLYSADSNIPSFYAPPRGISDMSVYSDDGLGTIIIRYYLPSGSGSSGIDLFVNNEYKACKSDSAAGYNYWTFKIPSFKRSSSYRIRLAPYHGSNSTPGDTADWTQTYKNQTYGPSQIMYANNTYGELKVKGTQYSKTCLENVTTVSRTLAKKGTGIFTSKRNITLSPYSMGAYEVTQELFYAVMGYNPTSMNYNSNGNHPNYPVNNVSWYEAVAFCNKLSALQGLTPCYTISGITESDWKNKAPVKGSGYSTSSYIIIPTSSSDAWNKASLNQSANGYHLPTECQWDFAARGGDPSSSAWGYTYAGGSSMSNYGWYVSNSDGHTHEVGKKYPNTLRLYDMCGNVVEWITDWDNKWDTNTGYDYKDPWCGYNTSNTSTTFVRNNNYGLLKMGGHYNRGESHCSIKSEDVYDDPWDTDGTVGFRVCRNVVY